MPNLIILRILKSNNDDSRVPGRFIPGAGAGRGSFQIDPDPQGYPRRRVVAHALFKWNNDSILNEYDEESGSGRFVLVDGDIPFPGTVIELQDTLTPNFPSALGLTLGPEGIEALDKYRAARTRFRKTGPGDMREFSLRLEDCQREGAQLAGWVLEAVYPND
ncbi:hypothetical protein ACIQAL_22070 [Pseudomonas sp. NPDC088368]|uniref:hypothetical protein n=1 Tax=Pseudomonas sp. NPDC088368 TaxID=3364453 RepID=UPI0037F85D28